MTPKKSVPMKCPVCCREPENYYGRLVFADEAQKPTCPNHRAKVELEDVEPRS